MSTPFKVNYQFASPTGAMRSGSMLIEANSADEAINITRASLIGKLKFLKVTGASAYNPDQQELPLKTKK